MIPVPEAPGDDDVLPEAIRLIREAMAEGVPLRLVGGLAVRVLCPDLPPRRRQGQDLDLASVASARLGLTDILVGRGFEPDRRFNALYGHKQLFFAGPDGRAVDVVIDRLDMCHVLDFRDRIDRLPYTLDVADLLLSKLQIVELNEKDVQDVLYLLSSYEIRDGDDPGTIGLDRITQILADDWGWWRTVTLNLDRLNEFLQGDGRDLVPAGGRFEASAQIDRLRRAVDDAPKSLRWRIRAKVGERKRWYNLPEEGAHD
jgi:hypothetical protein